MLPIIRCRTFDWHTNCKFSKEWFSSALLSAVPETFVKLQLDESKDVFVAHTSLGWQSLICRKSPTKQTLFDNCSKRTNPGGKHARHPLYCRVTTMVKLIPWPLFASNVGKFSSLYLLVMPKSQQLITTPRCGHITECITYDGVIIWPCFARDGSWVTPHISVWPHSHSIWWARTNHRRLFRRSCKKCIFSWSSTLWL